MVLNIHENVCVSTCGRCLTDVGKMRISFVNAFSRQPALRDRIIQNSSSCFSISKFERSDITVAGIEHAPAQLVSIAVLS